MSMYDNCSKDNLAEEILRFLEDYPVSELLKIVTDCVYRVEP